MRYVLGLTGGMTGTSCALYDADFARSDLLHWQPETVPDSFDGFRNDLRSMFHALLSRNNIATADIEVAVWGLTAMPEQKKALSEVLTEMGLSKLLLCSSAVVEIKTACCYGFGLRADCREQLAVVRVYDQLFRGAPYTELTTSIFRWLDITDRDDYLHSVMVQFEFGAARALRILRELLDECAASGDEAARSILESPAEHPSIPLAAGAVLWALEEIGITGHRERVLRCFSSGIRLC